MIDQEGADVNAQNEDGFTPLIQASYYGFEAVMRALIKGGASINVKDSAGITPLQIAVCHFLEKMVVLLIASGADVSICDDWYKTPLDYANSKIKKIVIAAVTKMRGMRKG